MLLSCLIIGLAAPSFSFPSDCPMMEPSTCASSDVRCDLGMDSNGCWMGDTCLPEGKSVPTLAIQPSLPPVWNMRSDVTEAWTVLAGEETTVWEKDQCAQWPATLLLLLSVDPLM